MSLRRLAALAAALALWPVAGCGDEAPERSRESIAVHAENGTVRLAGPPRRIVSISPTATEVLFAIGAGNRVVAVDEFSSYPPRAPRTELSYADPSAEAISRYRPDLVVLSLESSKVVSALERLEIPALVLAPARDLGDAYAQIELLGKASGRRAQARRVVERMKDRIAAIVDRTGAAGRGLSVYHELDPQYYSASSDTFVGRIYELLGLRNIADRAGRGGDYPKLSAEYVIDANPDLIVLADTVCCDQDLAALRRRPGLNEVSAVRAGNVLAVPDDLASRWGPRVVELVDRVARQVEQLR